MFVVTAVCDGPASTATALGKLMAFRRWKFHRWRKSFIAVRIQFLGLRYLEPSLWSLPSSGRRHKSSGRLTSRTQESCVHNLPLSAISITLLDWVLIAGIATPQWKILGLREFHRPRPA